MMSSCHQWVVSDFTYRVPVSHCVGSGGTEGHDVVLSPVGCLRLHLLCTSLPLCWFWWDQGTWCYPVTNGEVAWGDPEERSHQFCLLSSNCPASKRNRWPVGRRLCHDGLWLVSFPLLPHHLDLSPSLIRVTIGLFPLYTTEFIYHQELVKQSVWFSATLGMFWIVTIS